VGDGTGCIGLLCNERSGACRIPPVKNS
jgi:hypothetical protein